MIRDMKKPAFGHRVDLARRRIAARWDASFESKTSIWRRVTPSQLLVGSFLLLILLGTFGLMLLPGLQAADQTPLSFSDSLFTCTSAVCVTGLTVADTSKQFTFWGQVYLLTLIQLGGLGILAFTSLVIQILGFRLSLRAGAVAHDASRTGPRIDLKRLTLDVMLFTFLLEGLGTFMFWIIWAPRYGWDQAWWPALFHSISAFCNAGFSIHSDSLVGLRDSSLSLLVCSFLIVSGGLGFITISETMRYYEKRKRPVLNRLSLHTRLVLVTTALLLVVPVPMFALFEWNHTLAGLSVGDKLTNAFFLSVTPRTAGFNTIDYAQATDSTNFLTMILMTIGGSPGSTAGGLKTTAFALILLVAWSRFRGDETTVFANRSIPEDTIQRAIGLTVVVFAVMAIGVFILAYTEHQASERGHFLPVMFEAVSAFNTVGLSMNTTPHLSFAGRCVAIAFMFLGRVGPLTLAAALVISRRRRKSFRFAYEDVVVG